MAEVELPDPEELHERREDQFSRRVAPVTGRLCGAPGWPRCSFSRAPEPVFSFSLLLAVAGALLTLNGFFSFVRLPLMPGGH